MYNSELTTPEWFVSPCRNAVASLSGSLCVPWEVVLSEPQECSHGHYEARLVGWRARVSPLSRLAGGRRQRQVCFPAFETGWCGDAWKVYMFSVRFWVFCSFFFKYG